MMSRRRLLLVLAAALILPGHLPVSGAGNNVTTANNKAAKVVKYVRYEHDKKVSYGILEGKKITRIDGDLFGKWKKTKKTVDLDDVKLLVPSRPTQVFALAGNYKSHLGGAAKTTTTTVTTTTTIVRDDKTGETTSESKTTQEVRKSGAIPEKFLIPQPFYKTVSCLLPQGGSIVLPKDAEVVHFEAELVIVIGKKARNVSKKDALDYVLGVTCGNDISARVWQRNDVQWWRAKASDTFGPCGPCIVSGLDYGNLQLTLRLNGEVKQDESTKYFINDIPSTVSFLSKHVTLLPGDLIFTGTPGKTSPLKPGDVVEVELTGVGVLRNKVVAAK